MNLGKRFPRRERGADVAADIARILSVVQGTRRNYGAHGPYLFGALSAADAFYLPVFTRFATYGIETDDITRAYMETMLTHPAYLQWREAALVEQWVIAKVEVDEQPIEIYRKQPR
jgi:glutathione S-transferase